MKSIFLNKISNIVSRFSSTVSELFSVIRGYLFSVIRGPRPANLDCRITSGNDSKVECVASDNDSKVVQCGRSMIEMLGVLAIIGVLSIGGIAGYSKAMTKWKINKTIEQIEHITHGIFTAYANQKKMDDIYPWGEDKEEAINLLKSLNIISEDMIVDGELRDPFGGDILLSAGSYYSDSQWEIKYHKNEKFVSLEYINIPREACMALGSLDWAKGSAAVIGVGISSDYDNVHADPSECWLDNYLTIDGEGWLVVCNNGVPGEESGQTEDDRIPLPIPLDIVAEHCNCKDNDCYFGVAFTDK